MAPARTSDAVPSALESVIANSQRTPTPRAPWRLWQLLDSALPTGGFAHSAGLEALLQRGLVPRRGGLAAVLRDALWAAGHGVLPFVRAAAERTGDAAALASLDARCDATLFNHVANRASRAQGRALLAACCRVFPEPAVLAIDERARRDALPRHHAPVAGAVLGALGLAADEAQAIVLHWTARTLVSAAVRLGIAGPFEAQRIHAASAGLCDAVLGACGALGVDDVAQTAPLLEIAQMGHDGLYSRLFQS